MSSAASEVARDRTGAVLPGGFVTTRWELVAAAGDAASPCSDEALESLCRRYWQPLYRFLLVRGCPSHDAEDLTQSFFAHFLAKGYIRAADPRRGRFRAFLLTSFRHFANKQWVRRTRIKRGGRVAFVNPDESASVGGPSGKADPIPNTPSMSLEFDRQWALSLMESALHELRREQENLGRREWFVCLKPFLSTLAGAGDYESLAARLGVAPGVVAVGVHRLRKRYGELVNREVARTVSRREDADEELRHLIRVVAEGEPGTGRASGDR